MIKITTFSVCLFSWICHEDPGFSFRNSQNCLKLIIIILSCELDAVDDMINSTFITSARNSI